MDTKKLFVGNLKWETTEATLAEAFGQYGTVEEVSIVMDRPMDDRPPRPRGFAFVVMSTPEEATAAVNGLNDQDIDGRKLIVNHARPKEQSAGGNRDRGGFGGGNAGGSRGGYRG